MEGYKKSFKNAINFEDLYLTTINKFNIKISESKLKKYKTDLPEVTLNEKWLKIIWFEGKFERRGLKTSDGKKIIIESPGVWNIDKGPDFLNAKIFIDNKEFNGDVELHIKSSDWFLHNHDKDPLYNNSILHIVFFSDKDKQIITQNQKILPQIELCNKIYQKVRINPEDYPFTRKFLQGRCGKFIFDDKDKTNLEKLDFLEEIVSLAGDSRIILKSKKFPVKQGFNEEIFLNIAEALGYKENKNQMRMILENNIHKIFELLKTKITTPAIEGIMFGVSGLLPDSFENFDYETKQYLSTLNHFWKEYQKNFRKIDRLHWIFEKVRPLNFPTRRLSALSNLIFNYPDISTKIIEIFYNEDEKDILKKLYQIFQFDTNNYFMWHTNFGSKKFSSPKALIGKTRILTIIVNVIIPAMYAYAKANNEFKLETKIHSLYKIIPFIEWNRNSKLFFVRLFGKIDKKIIKKERLHQGLLQLFNDFCDPKISSCDGCLFITVLENFKARI